jgi:uncharacterized protein
VIAAPVSDQGLRLMLFTIHALDHAGALATRLANYEAHKTFLGRAGEYGVKIVMSGPLVEDDGQTMKGSFFLVEAATRAAVETFNGADPFKAANLWHTVSIVAFLRRVG